MQCKSRFNCSLYWHSNGFCNPTKLHSHIMGPEWSFNFIYFAFSLSLFFFSSFFSPFCLFFFFFFHLLNCRVCLWSTVKRTHSSGALTARSRIDVKDLSYCKYSKKKAVGEEEPMPFCKVILRVFLCINHYHVSYI